MSAAEQAAPGCCSAWMQMPVRARVSVMQPRPSRPGSQRCSLPDPCAQVVLFLAVNVVLWWYAQQNAPKAVQKRVGAKKAKREALKMGMRPAGDG